MPVQIPDLAPAPKDFEICVSPYSSPHAGYTIRPAQYGDLKGVYTFNIAQPSSDNLSYWFGRLLINHSELP